MFFLSMKYHAQEANGVYLETSAQPWPQSLDWVKPDPVHLIEFDVILVDFNKQASKDCNILGLVPIEAKAYTYDELYHPEPHYVSAYYTTSSQAIGLPIDSQGNIPQDS